MFTQEVIQTGLTLAAAGRGVPRTSSSLPDSPPYAPPPEPQGCWRTAPSASTGCPGCCCSRCLCEEMNR